MPPWSDILKEIHDLENVTIESASDRIIQKYLELLQRHTKRDTILYTSSWTRPTRTNDVVSITEDDLDGFMEVVYGLKAKELDLVLHSPGGSPEAAEAIVLYLHEIFEDIRVIIPHAAMSAATMISCASNYIVMGKHSFLGPTDPQMFLYTAHGWTNMAAQYILDDFDEAQEISRDDPGKLVAWNPLLSQYTPGFIHECRSAKELTKELVREWSKTYMFAGKPDKLARATRISENLTSDDIFKSHARHIPRKKCEEMGLEIIHLEDDEILQDLSLSVFHAANIFFQHSTATKIIKNHNDRTVLSFPPEE
ncbi:periplasmic serine protease (ClpP class) [Cenarchaeum symbiosum A]|uniref:Periplasmic serine protease (ClpP class) n=1 Tax=Cenarchaeum symbiosum (strain A) TaxID=414004 RepID=A0RUJ4_CENSY|nr:periplasmic serine protease (ClpP class) [Cenarchaeum symbiosum A]